MIYKNGKSINILVCDKQSTYNLLTETKKEYTALIIKKENMVNKKKLFFELFFYFV
jgi:hypothetical protein